MRVAAPIVVLILAICSYMFLGMERNANFWHESSVLGAGVAAPLVWGLDWDVSSFKKVLRKKWKQSESDIGKVLQFIEMQLISDPTKTG